MLCLSLMVLTTSCGIDLIDMEEVTTQTQSVETKELKEGSRVEVLAEPESGFEFSHWLKDGDIVSRDQSYTFTMQARDISLVAVFTKK